MDKQPKADLLALGKDSYSKLSLPELLLLWSCDRNSRVSACCAEELMRRYANREIEILEVTT